LNILIATAMFPPIQTGTSFYSRNLAAALLERGHAITVVTLQNADAELDSYPYPVHRLPALHVPLRGFFKHFRIASLIPSNFAALARLARDRAADVVLVINHYLDLIFPAAYAARRQRIPLVCSVGTQLQSSQPRRDRILNFLDRLVCGRLVFPMCDSVVAWDDEIRRYLHEVHGEKVIRKTHIVNFGPNGDASALASSVHDYAWKGQLLGVGAVTEQRDFLTLVRAYALLAPQFPGLHLKLIGHVYFPAAVELARELGLEQRIVFAGEKPHGEVLNEMRASDVFFVALSGRYQGLGTATLEAMLLGVPVVANVPPTLLGKASLRSGEHYVYADSTAPKEIAGCIGRLLNETALRARVGQGGRAFVREHLNWATVAKDMEAVLARAASRQ
jgi:glycosyltransferase involved in cell wall biosynthesis